MKVDKNHETFHSLWDEAWIPSIACRAIPCSLSNKKWALTSLIEFQNSQENCHKIRGTMKSWQQQERNPCVPNQLEMRPDSMALASEQSCIPNQTWQVEWLHLGNSRLTQNTVLCLEHKVQHSNSRKAPCTSNHLEMKADSQALTEGENHISTDTSRVGFSQL